MTEVAAGETRSEEESIVLDMLTSIDSRLARLEAILAAYEPLLAEAARRMAGPLKWRKER